MYIYSKILLLCIILLSSIILYRLIKKRQEINEKYPISEPYTSVNLVNTANTKLPFHQYFIKASWNSAYNYSNNTMDLDVLKNVISRGFRFVDMEIYTVQNNPVIGFSTQPTNYNLIECKNSLDFQDVINVISTSVFSNKCPNSNDPFILQLRMKTATHTTYNIIATILQATFTQTIVLIPSYKQLELSQLCGKILIFLDVQNSVPNVLTLCGTKDSPGALINYITDTVGNNRPIVSYSYNTLLKMNYTPPVFTGEPTGILVKNTSIVECFPDISTSNQISNIDVKPFIINYGIQIVPFMFYKDDWNLTKYETLFSQNGNCAFVSMATMFIYYTK
jgi:hypothetical protein